MTTITYIAFAFLLWRVCVLGINVWTNPRLVPKGDGGDARVSVLIPARNEAENLPLLFSQLPKLDSSVFEIIILNDGSEDETEALLQAESGRNDKLRYLNGRPLAEGWLGKSWACHQLAEVAAGNYFLFLDADVACLDSRLLAAALRKMKSHELSLLSIFPDQIMKTPGEWGVVPIMHYLLLSLLPLHWIYHIPFPSMAAANGQFMLFEAEDYRACLWHEQVKKVIVEDIAIMQEVKKRGKKGMAYLANGLIETRMYRSYEGGLKGFGKNILAGFGNSMVGVLVYLYLTLAHWLWLFWQAKYWQLGLVIILVMGMRWLSSQLAGQSALLNLLYHPWQMLNLIIISFWSIFKTLIGKNQWKGRNVQLN